MRYAVAIFPILFLFCLESYSQCSSCNYNMSFERAGGACDGEQTQPCRPDDVDETWSVCNYGGGQPSTTDIEPGSGYGFNIPATNGSTYLGLWASGGTDYGEGNGERVGFTMCPGTSLQAGTQYCFAIDYHQSAAAFNAPLRFVVEGGMTVCSAQEILWESPSTQGSPLDVWQTWNFCFTPTQNWTAIRFRVLDAPGGSFGGHLAVDNWRSTDGNFPPSSGGSITVTAGTSGTVCTGDSSQLSATPSGGSAPYTYAWSPSTGLSNPNVNNPWAQPTVTTTYTVTVTDGSGCTGTASVTITVDPNCVNPPCGSSACSYNMSFERSAGPCFGATCGCTCLPDNFDGTWTQCASWGCGSADINTGGGSGGSANINCKTPTDGSSFLSMECGDPGEGVSLTLCAGGELAAGTQYCFSIDLVAGGSFCGAGSAGIRIYGSMSPCAETELLWQSPMATGTWSTQNFCITPTQNWSNINFRMYGAGGFTAVGMDNWRSTDGKFPVNTGGGGSVNLTASTIDVLCNGQCDGAATATGTGGTSPYSYQWDAAAGNQTTQTATGLCAGSYRVTATDNNGCTDTINITIAEPPALSLDTSGTNSNCAASDGSVSVTASGGVGPYSYLWNDVSSQTTATATGLGVGSYTVTVTDSQGCTATITGYVVATNGFNSTVSSTNVSCNGLCDGTGTGNPIGGTSPYTYTWDDPNSQTTATATGLCAGNYSVIIADASGCSGPHAIAITEPTALVITESHTDVRCAGGSDGYLICVMSGGAGSYGFIWSDGSTDNPRTGLSSGNYCVTATDANGCTATICATINEALPIVLDTSATASTCGNCNGSGAVAVVSGGTSTFSYMWDAGAGNQTTTTATGLCQGTYTVTVTDGNNCQETARIVISGAAPVVLTTGSIDESCGNANGSATVTPSGGTSGYLYSWDNGQTTATATGLSAGNHCVTVTDSIGCPADTCILLTNVPGPVAVFTGNTVCEGSITGFTDGSSGGVTCTWDFGDSQTSSSCGNVWHLYAAPGTYNVTLTVTDAAGCTDDTTVSVTVEAVPAACFAADTLSGCAGLPVDFTNCTTGGSTYRWLFGDGDTSSLAAPTHLYGQTGCHDVTLIAVSAAGCTDTLRRSCYIEVFPAPVAGFSASPVAVDLFNPTVYFTDLSSGAVQWLWLFGDTGSSTVQHPKHTYGDTGTFTVMLIVTGTGGCTDTVTKTITVTEVPTFYVPNAFTPNGDGRNDRFFPIGHAMDPAAFELYIFDRWGNLIYETSSLAGWDGTANGGTEVVQEDTYVWLIVARDIYGADVREIGKVTVLK